MPPFPRHQRLAHGRRSERRRLPMTKPRKSRPTAAPNPPATPAEKALILGIAKTMVELTELGDVLAVSDEANRKDHDEKTKAIVFKVYRSLLPIWDNEKLLRYTLSELSIPDSNKNLRTPPYGFLKKALRLDNSQWTRYANTLCAAYAGAPLQAKRPMTADEFETMVEQLGGLRPFHKAYVPRKPRVPHSAKPKGGDPASHTAAVASPPPSEAALNMASSRLSEQMTLPPGVLCYLETPIEGTPLRRFLAEVKVDENGRQAVVGLQQLDDHAAAFDAPKKTAQDFSCLVSVEALSDFALDVEMLLRERGHDQNFVIIKYRADALVANIAGFECKLGTLEGVESDAASTPPATKPFSEASENAEPQSTSKADLPVNGGSLTSPSPPVPITSGDSVAQIKPLPDILADQSNSGDGANPANSGGEGESTVDGAASLVPPAPPKDQEPRTPHRPVVNETEAEHNAKVLRVIRRWYIDGTATSISAASKELKKESHRPFKGGQFHYENLKKLLNDAGYADLAALSKANLGDDPDPDGDGYDDPEPDDDGGGPGGQQPKTETTSPSAGDSTAAPKVSAKPLASAAIDAGRTLTTVAIDLPKYNSVLQQPNVPSSFAKLPCSGVDTLVVHESNRYTALDKIALVIKPWRLILFRMVPAAIVRKIILDYGALVSLSRQKEALMNIPGAGKNWRIIARLIAFDGRLTVRLQIWGNEYKSNDIVVSTGGDKKIEFSYGDNGQEYDATHLVHELKRLLNISNNWSSKNVNDGDVGLWVYDRGIQLACGDEQRRNILLTRSGSLNVFKYSWMKNQRRLWTKGLAESPAPRIEAISFP